MATVVGHRPSRRPLIVTLLLTLALAVASLAGSTTAAAASEKGHVDNHGPHHRGNPKGKGRFVPLEATGEPFAEVQDCGTTLTLSEGDVFAVKERVTEKRNGTLFEYKGAFTTDVMAADGRRIDELNNSGPYSVFERTDGSVTFEVSPPGLIYALSPEEAAAFEAAGLPTTFYFTKGKFADTIAPDGTVRVTRIPRGVVDVCDLLHR